MKKNIAVLGVSLLVLVFIVSLSLPVFAQEEVGVIFFNPETIAEEALARFNERNPGIDQKELGLEIRIEPADFGQGDWAWLWVGASGFIQEGVSDRAWQGNGYYRKGSTGGSWFSTNINLPSGSIVGRIALYAYDNHADSNISMDVKKFTTDGNSSVLLYSIGTTGQPGFTTVFYDPYFKFDNYHQYQILVFMPGPADGTSSFKGVRIGYMRMISPAPHTATFADVPNWHTFYQHIEALAASGITVGYTDGTYRPDNSVTRGEMAAFLARALGIHHKEPQW